MWNVKHSVEKFRVHFLGIHSLSLRTDCATFCAWQSKIVSAFIDVNKTTHFVLNRGKKKTPEEQWTPRKGRIIYHVRWESRGWIRGVWQWAGEACTGRGGESSRSRVRAEGWARGRSRQVFIPRGCQSRGPVSRTRIKSKRAWRLIEVTLRIRHRCAR